MPTMSPRVRRLIRDQQRLQERFAGWPMIQVIEAEGTPPERYRVQFNVTGLEVAPSGRIQERGTHLIEINLSLDYPRRMPQCRPLTPVFHPNFDQASVCIGDFWAASEGLDDLLVRIGRMIAYQQYNTKSPLSGQAARWAAENAHLLPVDARELAPPSPGTTEAELSPGVTVAEVDLALEGRHLAPMAAPAAGAAEALRAYPELPSTSEDSSQPIASKDAAGHAGETIRLAPELSLLALCVCCGRCGCEFEVELEAVQTGITCPRCAFKHQPGCTYRCVAVESAGLFWFLGPETGG